MGRTLYAYADKLWAVSQRFEPTNGARQFTLQPGEYLFMCYGGKGGERGSSRQHDCIPCWNYGAAAYGIFTTDQEETMYAMVGGNGNDYDYPTNPNAGLGGFNGGGNGGTSANGTDVTGAGGGGASDIRLSLDSTMITEPQRADVHSEYIELEYMEKRWGVDGCFNSGYRMNPNTRMEFKMWVQGRSVQYTTNDYMCLLGQRSSQNSADQFILEPKFGGVIGAAVVGPGTLTPFTPANRFDQIPFDCTFDLTVTPTRVSWTDFFGVTGSIENIPFTTTSARDLYIFCYLNNTSPFYDGSVGMRVYTFKIYENDELLHDFVPVKRVSDNALGFYDTVVGEFRGIIGTLYGKPKEARSLTLLSRILVAAGGGGNAVFSRYSKTGYTYGGGTYGSAIIGTEANNYYKQPDSGIQASQNDGYTFGQGMNGIKKVSTGSYGNEGAGGGGGGWFGGYSPAFSVAYSDIPGSGGSSYALTSDSWKPYGYVPTSHYHLTHTALVPCQSEEGLILICTPVNTLIPEDKIIVPFQGASTKIKLYTGTYDIKCWGGEGKQFLEGNRYPTRFNGGYSEGRLILERPHDVYGVVGGSGLFYGSGGGMIEPYRYNEYAGFNGGRGSTKAAASNNITYEEVMGGGATDLRLTMDDTPVHPSIPDPETRDDIPEGYTQLKAIVSTTHFDPGYIRKANSGFFIDMSTRDNLSGYEVLFGNGNDGSSRNYYFYTNPPSRSYVAHWQVTVTEANGTKKMPSQTRVKVTVTPTTVTWASATDSETLTVPEGSVQDGNMSMFFGSGRNGYGTEGGDIAGTWYAIKISESGTIVHDFVPCKNNSNNQIGWYDVITDTFYQWGNSSVPLNTYNYPSRSLMSRIIVAGGGGSIGATNGGSGGGTTGGQCASGQGVTGGPGTQTESPEVTGHPECNGGFGYGGAGHQYSQGRGGSGGAGWYGGSGTHPNGRTSNDVMGGNGGSGYVLTADSYKPEYYIPTSEFYMSNAVTTLGGNTLIPNMTKIEIDVIQAFCNKLLLYDMDGYKTYDENQNKWVVFSQTINPSLIEEYGRYDIPNINGMLDEFQVVVDDPENALSNIEVTSVPLPQSIVFLVPRRYSIGHSIIDAVYDTSIYDFSTNVSIYDDQYNAYTVTIDKTQESDEVLKLYSIMLFSQ